MASQSRVTAVKNVERALLAGRTIKRRRGYLKVRILIVGAIFRMIAAMVVEMRT